MSTQFYAPDQQATSRQVTSQPPASRQATSTSWIRIWAAVIGTAVTAVLVVLAVALWHGQSSATPATTGTPTSTSVPAQPSAPTVNPAVPSRPAVNPAVPSRPATNPAVPSRPATNPAVPATPTGAPGTQGNGASAR